MTTLNRTQTIADNTADEIHDASKSAGNRAGIFSTQLGINPEDLIFDIFILIQKALYQKNSNTTHKVLLVFLNVEWANKKEKMIPHMERIMWCRNI